MQKSAGVNTDKAPSTNSESALLPAILPGSLLQPAAVLASEQLRGSKTSQTISATPSTASPSVAPCPGEALVMGDANAASRPPQQTESCSLLQTADCDPQQTQLQSQQQHQEGGVRLSHVPATSDTGNRQAGEKSTAVSTDQALTSSQQTLLEQVRVCNAFLDLVPHNLVLR